MTGDLTIRFARPGDLHALAGLAELDSSHMPRGEVLVADVGGELWAAISMDDGHAVANPFRPTSELVFLLTERVRQLRRARAGRPPWRRPRLRRRVGARTAWS